MKYTVTLEIDDDIYESKIGPYGTFHDIVRLYQNTELAYSYSTVVRVVNIKITKDNETE